MTDNTMEKTDEGFAFELVLEEYKSLQAETHLRISENHKLLFFKMASCGALFSFVLSNLTNVHGVLIAPLIAVMVDFLIINNLSLIGTMGFYVATRIEKRYFQEGWDAYAAQTHFSGSKRITWLSDWLVTVGSTSVTYALTAVVLYRRVQYDAQSLVWTWRWCLRIFFGALLLLDLWYSVSILNIYSELKDWARERFSKSRK